MSIKELHRSLKIVPDIIESGEEILVLKNSAPAFKISAVRNSVGKKKTYSFQDLQEWQFDSGDTYLSENMDTLIY